MNKIEIIYGNEKCFESFYEGLTIVARERIYIEMVEPPSFEKFVEYQQDLIEKKYPVYYAIKNEQVVGWCDVVPEKNPRKCHRGGLAMGLIPDCRRIGIGTKLLTKSISHSKQCGFEKIELHVYTTNTSAIALYKNFGFEQEGIIRSYRKLDGDYFDCLAMGLFL